MALGGLVIPLSNTKETGWWAVTAPSFVPVATRTVKVMKGVLVGTPTLAAYYQVFVVAASFDRMAEAEAAGAL